MNFDYKRYIPDLVCVVVFAIIAVVYFYPADIDGRRLGGHDHSANDGISVEINAYRAAHGGETPRWVTSVFGGMPTYQIAPSYDSTKTMTFMEKVYHLWLPDYVWYIFASMLGFYILLRAFDFRYWMAALGAIVWAFSSYFFIIIAAGHIWKVMALAYIPPTIAGIVKTLSPVMTGRANVSAYLWGGILTAFFGALQIQANHVQMTYYFLIPVIFMLLAYLVMAVMNKRLAAYATGFGTLVVAAVVAVCLNASNLYHTYEYQKETMRGKSELVKKGKAEDQTSSGLERSYITNWSYGIDETWTLLVPNVKGGASVALQSNPTAMKKANPQFGNAGIYGAFTQYWGEQPGTSGPVYVGAIVCMLFVLGLILIPNKNPLKWALILATVLSILLSWGKNFMPFTDFFIDHVPMYAKFRTVASILVVAEFTIPFIALWGLKEFIENPKKRAVQVSIILSSNIRRPSGRRLSFSIPALGIAACVTALACVYFAVSPGECISSMDREAVAEYVRRGYFDAGIGQSILQSVSDMRAAMLTSDAWRSFGYILAGAAAMLFFVRSDKDEENDGGKKAALLCGVLFVLCLVDMWQVNKRYLYDDMFKFSQGISETRRGEAEDYILETSGTLRDYRVLDLTVSTFNDNTAAALFNSVGGYHAAKLRRYQELIEEHLHGEITNLYPTLQSLPMDSAGMFHSEHHYPLYDLQAANADSIFPVLNMLNTRWFLLGGGGDGSARKFPVENNSANGPAWFVSNVKYVDSANEEIEALHHINTKHTAVVAKKDFGFLTAEGSDGKGSVKLTEYGANSAKYEVESGKGGLVVFSEVYYPGWTATIDGTPAQLGRADYVLRALNVPAGRHEVVLSFTPTSVATTETIAYSALALLILALIGALVQAFRKSKEA